MFTMRDFIIKMFSIDSLVTISNESPLCDQVKLMITLTSGGSDVPMLTPVIVPATESLDMIAVCNYFPGNQKVGDYKKRFGSNHRKLRLINSRCLFDGHEVKDIDHFDYGKTDKIREYVHNTGALTFRISDLNSMTACINGLSEWGKTFKYSSITKFYDNNRKGPLSLWKYPKDKLAMYISMIDLPLAMPIYNARKVDGITVTINIYWPESSEESRGLYFSKEVNMVLSNYEENIFTVDGTILNTPATIGTLSSRIIFSSMRKQIEYEVERQKEPVTLSEQEERENKLTFKLKKQKEMEV